VQAGIFAAAVDELGMRAAVDDAPVVDDDDLVGRLRGGEPVGEGDRGAPPGEAVERALGGDAAVVAERNGLVERRVNTAPALPAARKNRSCSGGGPVSRRGGRAYSGSTRVVTGRDG